MFNHLRTHNIRPGAHSQSQPQQPVQAKPLSRQARITWTIGNLLMLAGFYLLFLVGGFYAQAEYNRRAARGDSDLPIMVETMVEIRPSNQAAPVFQVPILNNRGQVVSNIPAETPTDHLSTVSRIIIPAIAIDSRVIEVGWRVEEQAGTSVAVWDVAEYAVGQHKGSANPGEGSNIVLAGHVGGYGKVFYDLYHVTPGDQITLYSNGQQYLYVVAERLVLDEEGVAPEQRAANASYIEPTNHEVVTLVTCWPPSGPGKFTQRVIVRAIPYTANEIVQAADTWTAR